MSDKPIYAPEDTKSSSPAAVQARLKTLNLSLAEAALMGVFPIMERMMEYAATTEDSDQLRKTVDTLHKIGTSALPQQNVQVWAPLNFSIVTDRNVPQIAPSASGGRLANDVSFVELPPPDPVSDTPTALSADIDELVNSLMSNCD